MIGNFRNKNKNVKYILIRFFAEFVSRASSIILFPVMAKYLGATGYGVNTQINTIVSFLIPILTMGLGYGIVKYLAGQDDKFYVSSRLKTSLLLVFIISCVISIIVYFSSPIITQFIIKEEWANQILQWSIPLIIFSSIELVLKEYFRARLYIIEYSVIQIIQTIIYVSSVTVILTTGFGLLQVIWSMGAIKLVIVIISISFLYKKGDIIVDSSWMALSDLKILLMFGFPVVVANIGTWLTQLGDRWVIGYFLSVDQVGIYNANYTLASIIIAIGSPFWSPLYPLLAAAQNKNDEKLLYSTCRRYLNAFSLLAFPSFLGLSVLSNDLITKFGTTSFQANSLVFFVICTALVFDQLSTPGYYFAYLSNQTIFIRNITITTAFLNLLLNSIFVPSMGIMGW